MTAQVLAYTALFVGNSDHGNVQDPGQVGERRFDVSGIDVPLPVTIMSLRRSTTSMFPSSSK